MRPKCTVIDDNGLLAIGKFPSVDDTRSATAQPAFDLNPFPDKDRESKT